MQTPDFEPKKLPKQQRSKATFDAIVDACTQLLPEMGYSKTTTNHIAARAGVGISSLYEYFPNKDAVIAQVAGRMVNRIINKLKDALPTVYQAPPNEATRIWIYAIYDVITSEKKIVAVFLYEIPYTNQLKVIRNVFPVLLTFSTNMSNELSRNIKLPNKQADMRLMINLVTTTILQLVLHPPKDISTETMLNALAARLDQWVSH